MESPFNRFWRKVAVGGPEECWLWIGATRGPYGVFYVSGGVRRVKRGAHQVVYEWEKGEIPEGLSVLHRCDTPLCVNPDHLWLGTLGDNNRDRAAKGRSASGAKNGNARLTTGMALAMRDRYATGETSKSLAAEYGVNQTTVARVANGRSWTHL